MVWILPTLDRPAQCAAVLTQMTKMECSTPGILFLNGDATAYCSKTMPIPDKWDFHISGGNVGALGALNYIFKERPNEPFYGFIGDDEFVHTKHFDTKLIEAAGDWDISHGNDGFNRGKRAQGYLCIGGKLARAVGYLALPEAWHWHGLDSMWEALADIGAIEKRYVPTVYVNHKHPLHGKGETDECYKLGESRKDMDQQVFLHWIRHHIKDVALRIKKAKKNDKVS